MKIDRRITNGLVWAGVVIVLGVPAADLVSAQLAGNAPPQLATAVPQPQEPAPEPALVPETPAPTPAPMPTPAPELEPVAPQPVAAAPQAGDPVQSYLQSGRALPSYISDAPASAASASTPAPVEPAAPEPAPTVVETAALPPAKVAPVPMPHSMRPKPVEAPLIVDAPAVLPPARMGEVTAADLEDWETGPLSDFLAQRARDRGEAAPSDYDANGFFLDQGPDNRPRQRSYLVGPADDYYFAD